MREKLQKLPKRTKELIAGALFILAGLCFLAVPASDQPLGRFLALIFGLAACLCFFGKWARPVWNVGFLGLVVVAWYLAIVVFEISFKEGRHLFGVLGGVLALMALVLVVWARRYFQDGD